MAGHNVLTEKVSKLAGLSKRFRVAGDAKKVGGGPTTHETYRIQNAALIILILFFIELPLFNHVKI